MQPTASRRPYKCHMCLQCSKPLLMSRYTTVTHILFYNSTVCVMNSLVSGQCMYTIQHILVPQHGTFGYRKQTIMILKSTTAEIKMINGAFTMTLDSFTFPLSLDFSVVSLLCLCKRYFYCIYIYIYIYR